MKKTYDEFVEYAAELLEGLGPKQLVESFDVLYESYPEYTDMMLTEMAVLDEEFEPKKDQIFH